MNMELELLQRIEKRLESIEDHLGIMKKDCSKMGEHIHFVERVYSVLRKPLCYIITRKTDQLPSIKNDDS